MTVKELIEKLSECDDDAIVHIEDSEWGELDEVIVEPKENGGGIILISGN